MSVESTQLMDWINKDMSEKELKIEMYQLNNQGHFDNVVKQKQRQAKRSE